jgi:hypothetical protein
MCVCSRIVVSNTSCVVCRRRAHVLFTLCVFVCVYSGVQHILCCVFVLFFFVLYTLYGQFLCFSSSCTPYMASFSVFLRPVHPIWPVSLFFFVLYTLYGQFLCFSSSCTPYMASFSVFLRLVHPIWPVSLDSPYLIAPFVLSNFYFQQDKAFIFSVSWSIP